MTGTISRLQLSKPPATAEKLCFASVFRADAMMMFAAEATKSAVISQLVKRLAVTARLNSDRVDEICDRIIYRERLASTALGRGLAFPHLRTPHVQDFIGAIGILPPGIYFDSNDGAETRLVFLTLSPYASREHHTQLLSRLVSLLSNRAVVLRLLEIRDPTSFHQMLCGSREVPQASAHDLTI